MTDKFSETENYQGVWNGRISFGKKPVLLLVDFMQGYTTPGLPLYAPDVVTAVNVCEQVLAVARQTETRVIHTNILYHLPDQIDGGIWVQKSPVMRAMVSGNPAAEFCEQVKPLTSELVITKQYASAFFGTSVAATLTAQGVDTVVIVGCSTRGCVRATAVDAVQHGFRTIVLRDGVGDRHRDPHEANLFDIDSKYGDVITAQQFIDHIQS